MSQPRDKSDSSSHHLKANQNVLSRIFKVEPAWTNVLTAHEAIGLESHTLLHAGPPFLDPTKPSQPVLSSCVLVCLQEGWANCVEQAEALITSGKVRLLSALQFNVLMPLAAVASCHSALVEISDLNSSNKAWSLLSSGAGPQIRFGSRDLNVIERLRWRDTVLATELRSLVTTYPVPLLPIARAGLSAGDDLHASTAQAQVALNQILFSHLSSNPACAGIRTMLENSPLFFLTLWIAACHLMLHTGAAQGSDRESSLVISLAGNGESLGIKTSSSPESWLTIPGVAPQGPFIKAEQRIAAAPLVGDSGVIDAAGFGAQALHCAPQISEALSAWLPDNWRALKETLMLERHPFFADLNIRTGMDFLSDVEPIAAIAMLGADGASGLLGRGIVRPGPKLFAQARTELFKT